MPGPSPHSNLLSSNRYMRPRTCERCQCSLEHYILAVICVEHQKKNEIECYRLTAYSASGSDCSPYNSGDICWLYSIDVPGERSQIPRPQHRYTRKRTDRPAYDMNEALYQIP